MSDPLKELARIAPKRLELEKRTFELVVEAREAGESWTAIGKALGISRQAAWERFESWRLAPTSKDS